MALVVTCPACQKRLQVPDELIGQNVQCPECKGTFVASSDSPTGAVTTTPSKPSAPPPKPAWEQPLAEDKPRKSSKRRSRYDEDDDDDDDDRPRRRSRRSSRSRSYLAPHRGGMILAFGIISFVFAPIIFGPMAWVMGGNDLQEMRAGRMDPTGEGMTQTGRILGMISTILSLLFLVLFCTCFFAGIVGNVNHGRRF